jgi:hypothetical protein
MIPTSIVDGAVIEHTDGTKLQVDVVGLDLTALIDTRQVEPFELFGPQYPGGKIFNKAAFAPAPKGVKAEDRNRPGGWSLFTAVDAYPTRD